MYVCKLCMYVCICVYVYVCMYVCMFVCVRVRVRVRVCVCVCDVCVYVYLCFYILSCQAGEILVVWAYKVNDVLAHHDSRGFKSLTLIPNTAPLLKSSRFLLSLMATSLIWFLI